MAGKSVQESSVTMTQLMSQQDVNRAGNVHGGVVMKLIDTAAGVVAARHTRSNVVTASLDRLDFHHPVFVGDLVTLKASLNLVGKSSMEIGVRVQSENIITGEIRHTASAYLTFVALDKDGKPAPIPPVIPETGEEIRRNREAQVRRERRLQEKSTRK
ncbi:acyl-CoA thioesterase [Chloroflexota bacterium]